jgi:sulfite reductase (NADPH) flavoprotein alpha-component
MLRTLHSIPGLIVSLLLVVIAAAGTALSVFPALERVQASSGALDAATLASRVTAQVPGVQTIVRRPSGTIVAYYLVADEQRASIIDPTTGRATKDWQPSAVHRWLRNLHRKLLLSSDAGRIAVGVAAASLLFIIVCGLLLLAHRMGGWSRLAGRIRGNRLQRLHDETARVALAGLLLSSATGVMMSLSTFGLLPEGGEADPFLDVQASGAAPMALADMAALRSIDVSRLRQIKFASPDDPADVIEFDSADGTGIVDPAKGTWLAWQRLDGWQQFNAIVKMLHTGEGLWWLGLLLGVASITVPVLATSGFLLWLWRRRNQPRLAGNVPVHDADTLLLVGSESNMTWGFAIALHDALVRAGLKVHTAPMNDVGTMGGRARRLLVLTATYGDGEAPDSARHFLERLARLPPAAATEFAVLGFGDRQFPNFCGYARRVHEALSAHGLKALGEPGAVDRQSEPEFRQWCEWLAGSLGLALEVRYQPLLPRTTAVELVSRTDYGVDCSTRTAVLRFGPAPQAVWRRRLRFTRLPAFETGDLLGVIPPGGAAPRYYSLASAASDGIVELCVRRYPGGVCSEWLTDLEPGATIEAFVRPHESFRPKPGSTALILVGAGTGIGPLIGLIRHNPAHRPMHLYFGVRSAEDGFLYGDELQLLVKQGCLRTLATAFSRATPRTYVQDRLLADAQHLRELLARGAQVMVCGGRAMGQGVARAFDEILAGSGLSVAQLRAQGRYVEDVY